jgi:hypothetical protein
MDLLSSLRFITGYNKLQGDELPIVQLLKNIPKVRIRGNSYFDNRNSGGMPRFDPGRKKKSYSSYGPDRL